jgi:perosamine synthetase
VHDRHLVFDEPAFQDHPRGVAGEVPPAEALVREVLSLPVHPQLTEAALGTIVRLVRQALA